MIVLACLIQSALVLPAHTAYLLSPGGARLTEGGTIRNWTSEKTEILWGGYLSQGGRLNVSPRLEDGSAATYRLHVVAPGLDKTLASIGPTPRFDGLEVRGAGWIKLTLSAKGTSFGKIAGLELSGDATVGAKFNMKTRLNAASVHIGYPLGEGQEVEWFYNEVKAQTDPLYTYYEACGFRRGYFGMQVNGEHERRIIFSIWDAGKEAVDRNKVADENRVKLLGKGEGVVADSFGNEGTGGHSHLVYMWKTPVRQRFLVHAQKDGDGTIYTGYFFMPEKHDWMLIASFRAPKDGALMRGLYSFVENFGGENGHLKRAAEFGTAWVKPKGGEWIECKTGRFTHDVTGGKDRFDYDMRAMGNRFLLQNGGFEGSSPKLGTLFTIPGGSTAPKIDLGHLPK